MSQQSPRLNLPLIAEAQAQKHITHNEALAQLDLLVQLTVQTFEAVSPPAAPIEGEIYGVGAGATGDWAGADGQLAGYVNGGWTFLTPLEGWRATDVATGIGHVWSGGSWSVPAQNNLDGIGINATFDATNKVSVASKASLFSHDGAGHQMKLNKALVTDTASLLFQSNWSGRAEMGLIGEDAFAVKVSADGASWTQAIKVDPTTGFTGIGPDAGTDKVLSVAANATGVAIQVRNTGGAGGATFECVDDASGAQWRFKTTSDGAFKLRDQTGGVDQIYLRANPRRVDFTGGLRPGVYTMATLPDPAVMEAGAIIFVSDEAGGPVIAFSDGTAWRRMTDRAVVS